MNIRNKTIAILMFFTVILSNVASAQAIVDTHHQSVLNPSFTTSQPQQESGDGVVLKENQQGLTFSVQIPWEELELKEVELGGKIYTDLILPGWSETMIPGAPQLPFLTEQLGAPIGAEITLQITTGKSHEFLLANPPLPSTTQKIILPMPVTNSEVLSMPEPETITEMDPLIYYQDKPFPEQPAAVAANGFLRQQRVVGINLFPIQVLPSKNTLVVYESLEVKVTFSGKALNTVDSKKPESDLYEQLFKDTLLNYETAQLWRTAQSEPIGSTIQNSGLNALPPWTPPNPGWRVKTTSEGMHKLTYAELEAAGLPVTSLNPQTFQLFNNGAEVAIQVIGESNGTFDAGDYLLFYAQTVNNKYTSENVYWLTYGAIDQGLRMVMVDGTPTITETPVSFLRSEHIENNLYYLSQIPGDHNFDRWVGDLLYTTTSTPAFVNYKFPLISPTPSAATIKLAFMGYLQSAINPDHHLVIKLNGAELGHYWFDGRTYQIIEMVVPANLLIAGENLLEVIGPNDTGVGYEVIFLDWVELAYESGFLTDSGSLAFDYAVPGTYNFQVASFDTEAVSVFDVTDPTIVKKVSGVPIAESGGSFMISFQDTVSTNKSYYVVENSAFIPVKAIEMDASSSLSLPTNAADYILITPKVFKTQADTLSTYRTNQGLRTRVVDLQDIYDEFGYGVQDVRFIRDFLSYAYHNWQAPAPAIVVLLGDGNYDPKRYISTSLDNHMPTYLGAVDPWIVETAADNRYVTFIGADTLPDMMLGRLTANDVAEAEVLVNKIITYEGHTSPDPWKQKVLFVADNADSAGNFAQLSENLISCCLPGIYQAEKVYFVPSVPPATAVSAAKNAILNAINQGVLLVNYIGHAGIPQWTNEGVFKSADISLLANPNTLPIVLSMTCYDGYYHTPLAGFSYEAMAEVFTGTSGKGAVASWSPTGLGVASGHDYLNRGFFDALFKNGAGTIGEATTAGKLRLWSTGNNLDLLDTYLLFGDPAMRMPLAETANHPPVITEGYSTNVTMSEDGSPVAFAKTLTATDPDPDTLTWSISTPAQHGTATASGTGTSVAVGYVPQANYFGTDLFVVQVSDGTATDTIMVNVIIEPVNDAPIAFGDSYSIAEDQILTVAAPGVLVNDSDIDRDPLTAVLVSGSGPLSGSLTLNADGSFSYTPIPNYYGSDSFSYRVYDGKLYSSPVVVSLTITAVNDPPVAYNDSYAVVADQPLNIALPGVLLNDIDVDGDAFTAVLVPESGPQFGSLTLNPDGSFTYTPDASFTSSDSFMYQAYDGQAYSGNAVVSLAILPNRAPVADNDSFTVAEDQTLNVPAPGVLEGDSDPDGNPLTAVLISGPAHGQFSLQSNGSFSYTPYLNYYGSDSFSYRASDGDLTSNTAVVSLTITPVNDAPVVDDIPDQTIPEGQIFASVALDTYVNDPDNLASEMTWSFLGNTQLTVIIIDRVATITAPANWSGSETVTFRATDPEGLWDEDTAVLTITAKPLIKFYLPLIFR